MVSKKKLIVFTDLDGTLLDHHTYCFEAALPAIARLKKNDINLILTTSKTIAEVEDIKNALGIEDPCIVENGSVIYTGNSRFSQRILGSQNKIFGKSYKEICLFIEQLPFEVRQYICGFYDMSVDEVAASTNLTTEQAKKSKDRLASEPFLWTGSEEAFTFLKVLLKDADLSLLQGGRFYHILSKIDKAQAISWFMEQVRKKDKVNDYQVCTLGDGPNDVKMLEQADIGVVIATPTGNFVSVKGDHIIFSQHTGPQGWCDEMNKIMDQMGLGE